MATTTELTEKYLNEHPSIKDCLKSGVINYSKLSRKIAKELGIEKRTSMEAILVACRRYAAKLDEGTSEDKILRILRKSELEIKNKIVVAVVSKKIFAENLIAIEKKVRSIADTFYVIEGTKVFTIITSEKYMDDINKLFGRNVLKLSDGMAMVIIKSPEDMEKTPGVVSYVYSLLADHGVNVVETMSCWTDTIVVVAEKEIPVAMEFLRF